MALARTDLLVQDINAVGTGPFGSNFLTPPDNSLLVVAVFVMENAGTTDPSGDLTLSGGGWTYTSRAVIGDPNSFSIGLRIFTAPVTTGASMTLTLDCGPRDVFMFAFSAVAYTGYDTISPVGATATGVDNSTPDGAFSVTLSGAPAASSEVFAALGMDKESLGTTPGAAFGEIHDTQNSINGGLETEARTGSTSTTVDWVDTHTGSGAIFKLVAAAIEIKAAGAGTDPTGGPPTYLPPWLIVQLAQAVQSRSAGTTPGGQVDLDGSLAVTATITGTSQVDHNAAGDRPTTATITATGAVDHPVAGDRPVTATETGTLAITRPVDGTRPTTATITGSLDIARALSGSLSVTATETGALAVDHTLDGTRTITAGRTASLDITRTLDGTRPVTATITGDITVSTPGVVNLVGDRPITDAIAGTLAVSPGLDGSRPVTATIQATLALARALAGNRPTVATITGALDVAAPSTAIPARGTATQTSQTASLDTPTGSTITARRASTPTTPATSRLRAPNRSEVDTP